MTMVDLIVLQFYVSNDVISVQHIEQMPTKGALITERRFVILCSIVREG